MNIPLLNQSQLKQYHEQGYVLLGRILDDAMLESMRREEARLRQPVKSNEGLTIFRSQMCNYSKPVRDVCLQGNHLSVLPQLIGPNVALWFNQFVTKLPDAASGKSEFPWHQDNGYTAIDPANNITIWTALDDVDERNGCVWVMPGSHRHGLRKHKAASAENWHLTLSVEGDGIPGIMPAGHAIAFSGLTLHRSKLNHTDQPRRAFFMEYTDLAATYFRSSDAPRKPVLSAPDSWPVLGELPWTGTRPELGY